MRYPDDSTLPDTPGAFCWQLRDDERWLLFVCPTDVTQRIAIPVRREGEPGREHGPTWLWDGDEDHPTLTPSINAHGACVWHGWMTGGFTA